MNSKTLIQPNVFFQEEFKVDECLSKYTHKTDLETLRKELKNYEAELQQHMSKILKNETEAIVNLAEHLTNLNTKIENLCCPICQLREEIMGLNNLIRNTEETYSVMLKELKNNNKTQNNIHLKLGIITSSSYIETFIENPHLDLFTLERIITKFSFQKKHMHVLGIITNDLDQLIKVIETKLTQFIDVRFFDSFKNEDRHVLTRCLRMYDNLEKHENAEETFRIEIVKPYLYKIVSERNFEKVNQDIDKIYCDILDFLDEKLELLTSILRENPDLKCFNFVKNSFWKEFNKQSLIGLPHICAPGNPELFQKRFKSTWNLLKKIAIKCGNENLIKEEETFQSHMERFNLPVYFEICFQKIAGSFENDLIINDNGKICAPPNNEISCKLKPTLSLWFSFCQCFSNDVFIDQLADQFLKLSMMLLSRYLTWFEAYLKDTAIENPIRENILMDSLTDLDIIENHVANDNNKTSPIKTLNPNLQTFVYKTFQLNKKSIDTKKIILKNRLISMKFNETISHLQNIASIPRLYRRTNRTAPKEPSAYVIEAIKPLTHFHTKCNDEILNELITKITKQYQILVEDVLQSVCKTEESLRKLKNRNVLTTEENLSQSDTMSDEMKIREQIKHDVLYFLNKVNPMMSASKEDLHHLRKIIQP